MKRGDRPMSVAPFPSEYRASGALLHVTSLPSSYGIGDMGPAAFEWIDRLHEAGQSGWQSLPLGPTGYGNSPYQAISSFAGNGLIGPELLRADGLLSADVCESQSFHRACSTRTNRWEYSVAGPPAPSSAAIHQPIPT